MKAAYLAFVPADTRDRLEDFTSRIPLGVLAIIGPPGTGKTDVLAMLTAASIQSGAIIGASAPSNSAVTVLLNRVSSWMHRMECINDFLVVRAYASHVEVDITKYFLKSGHQQSDWDSDPITRSTTWPTPCSAASGPRKGL